MGTFTHDEVVDYLPQLVQALKHETFETSALAKFLLERALLSPRVAHYLFWLLTHFLPDPQLEVSSHLFIWCLSYQVRLLIFIYSFRKISIITTFLAPLRKNLSQTLVISDEFSLCFGCLIAFVDKQLGTVFPLSNC